MRYEESENELARFNVPGNEMQDEGLKIINTVHALYRVGLGNCKMMTSRATRRLFLVQKIMICAVKCFLKMILK